VDLGWRWGHIWRYKLIQDIVMRKNAQIMVGGFIERTWKIKEFKVNPIFQFASIECSYLLRKEN
jgi:hypothetical protein